MTNKKTLFIVEAAIMIALASVLSEVKFFSMPHGGSVTAFSMLPIVMMSMKYGVKKGLIVSSLYGVIQMALSFAKVSGWGLPLPKFIACLLLDYVIAYALIGFAGIFREKNLAWQCTGVAFALLLRFASHFVSGIFLWSNWIEGASIVLTGSVLGNLFMLPEIGFTMIGAILLLRVPYIKKLFTPLHEV